MDTKIEGITKEIMQVCKLNQLKARVCNIPGVMEQVINGAAR